MIDRVKWLGKLARSPFAPPGSQEHSWAILELGEKEFASDNSEGRTGEGAQRACPVWMKSQVQSPEPLEVAAAVILCVLINLAWKSECSTKSLEVREWWRTHLIPGSRPLWAAWDWICWKRETELTESDASSPEVETGVMRLVRERCIRGRRQELIGIWGLVETQCRPGNPRSPFRSEPARGKRSL